MTQIGVALKRSFDLLNQYRLNSNVDNYGQGRYPFIIEPATIVLITDGGQFTSFQGVMDEVYIVMYDLHNS